MGKFLKVFVILAILVLITAGSQLKASDPPELKPYLKKTVSWKCTTQDKTIPMNIYFMGGYAGPDGWKDAFHKFDQTEFDVHSRQAYTFGGNHDRDSATFWRGNHPRGLRWAFTDWDFNGLRTAVQIQGTINDSSDIDKGWTVEIAFPWKGMTQLAGGRSLPPKDSDIWRIFLGRFGKLAIGNTIVSNSMSLDPVGDNDNHLPERFTRFSFSTLTGPAKQTK